MQFVIATRIVERGDALQLGKKCGSDGQVLVGLFDVTANMLTLYRRTVG
jgi:hypothetical protein